MKDILKKYKIKIKSKKELINKWKELEKQLKRRENKNV